MQNVLFGVPLDAQACHAEPPAGPRSLAASLPANAAACLGQVSALPTGYPATLQEKLRTSIEARMTYKFRAIIWPS